MAVALLPFLVLSVLGLVLSLVAHTAALLGLPQPLGPAAWGLHLGIFVVWLPAVIVSNRMVGDFKQKDYWKAALRGCPHWMRWLTYGFFAYAVVNFLLFMAVAPPRGAGGGVNAPPEVFRGFSGHWMAFYSAAAAILYSAIVVARRDPARRCPNGHPVSPSAAFCDACGAAVIDAAGGADRGEGAVHPETPDSHRVEDAPSDDQPEWRPSCGLVAVVVAFLAAVLLCAGLLALRQ